MKMKSRLSAISSDPACDILDRAHARDEQIGSVLARCEKLLIDFAIHSSACPRLHSNFRHPVGEQSPAGLCFLSELTPKDHGDVGRLEGVDELLLGGAG